jgi:hypothetical protein
MRLPEGRLVRARVVADPRTALVDALDRRLTGYAVLDPQETVILDGESRGVVTFEEGVPVASYHTGTGRGGPPALADLAAAGPYRLELVAAPRDRLAPVYDCDSYRVPPGVPAERLAGDGQLAERTRAAAPDRRLTDPPGHDGATGRRPGAVEAFLDDEEKIQAIREAAREEARERADQWGFDV